MKGLYSSGGVDAWQAPSSDRNGHTSSRTRIYEANRAVKDGTATATATGIGAATATGSDNQNTKGENSLGNRPRDRTALREVNLARATAVDRGSGHDDSRGI